MAGPVRVRGRRRRHLAPRDRPGPGRVEASAASVRFAVQDFLTASVEAASYADSRARFAAQVGRVLAPGGRWLSIAASTESARADREAG